MLKEPVKLSCCQFVMEHFDVKFRDENSAYEIQLYAVNKCRAA